MKIPLLTSIAIGVVIVGGLIFLALPLFFGKATQANGYAIDPQDSVSSWTWKGVYQDGGEKESQTNAEIASLKGSIGKQGQSTYDLNVGIASGYELLGDGKNAYQYLSQAIESDPKRGLAYMNMGHLMEELGAFHTARVAYEKATALEPDSPLYKASLQDFLARHP